MRNFLYTIKSSDVVEGIDTGGETSMEAKDLIVDKSGQGKIVEEVGEVLPYIRVAVLSKAFVIEAIDLRDLAGFVVSTEDCDSLGISNLESN